MSDSNVRVTITADVSGVQSALQSAVASTQQLSAAMQQLQQSLSVVNDAASAEAMRGFAQAEQQAAQNAQQAAGSVSATADAIREQGSAAQQTASSVSGLRGEFNNLGTTGKAAAEEVGSSIKKAHGNSMAFREGIVLLHEAMQGRFNRMAGSVLVLAEAFSGGLTPAMMGIVATAAVVGLALYHLIEIANELKQALADAFGAAYLQGRPAVQVRADTEALALQYEKTANMGRVSATQLASGVQQIGNVTDETRAKMAQMAPMLEQMLPGDKLEEKAREVKKIFETPENTFKFVEANNMFTASQQSAADAAKKSGDNIKLQQISLDAMSARLGPITEEFKKQKDAVDAYNKALAQPGGTNVERGLNPYGAPPGQARQTSQVVAPPPQPQSLLMPQLGQMATQTPQQQQDAETVSKVNSLYSEQKKLQDELAAAKRVSAEATTTDAKAEADSAVKTIQDQLALLHAKGDVTWAEKQRSAIASAENAAQQAGVKAGETQTKINQDVLQAKIGVLQKDLQATNLTDQQKMQIETELATTEKQLSADKEREKEANARKGLAAAKRDAKEILQEKLAEFSAEQAADRENYNAWMAIEQQKLALIRQVLGEKSAQFQRELKQEETYEQEHTQKLAEQGLKGVEEADKNNQDALKRKQKALDDEVKAGEITKEQEIQLARQAGDTEYASEIQGLQNFINTLDKRVQAYAQAMSKMEDLKRRQADFDESMDDKMAAEQARVAQQMARPFISAFDSIGGSFSSAITGMLNGTETWGQAERNILSNLTGQFVNFTMEMVSRWIAAELMKTVFSNQQSAIREATNNKENLGVGDVLGAVVGRWLGMETGKTAITTQQNTVRVAQDQIAATASGNAILIPIADYEFGQTAMTGANATGNATRVAADQTAATASKGANAAAGAASIMADAKMAAAGAYASAAQVPVVGWILGPAAAAAAFGAVMAYDTLTSLDQGTAMVPGAAGQPMLSIIHGGEAVLPFSQASELRAALSGGTSGQQGQQVNVTFAPQVSAIDAQGVKSFISQYGKQITATVAQQLNNNPSLRPSY